MTSWCKNTIKRSRKTTLWRRTLTWPGRSVVSGLGDLVGMKGRWVASSAETQPGMRRALARARDGKALDAAEAGVLLQARGDDLDQLLSALRAVAAGGSVIDPQVVDALVSRRARLQSSPVARLSPRELDVLREMAQGRGNAGIAQALHLSESSVEKHVNAIFTKLDLASEQQVHRRVAAVLTFLRDAGLQPRQSPGG